MGISIILWDVDGTLLDFSAAEKAALAGLFHDLCLGELTDGDIFRYRQINESLWRRIERNEIGKAEALVARFEQFFREIGAPVSLAPEFNRLYLPRLGDTIAYRDDSLSIVRYLRGKVRQYVVSNGTVVAQNRKLERSGLGELMDGVFLSEAIGAEKPGRAFFDAVFSRIRPASLSEVMIVGDSLTSDIRGGIDAGIVTCWYNPERKSAPEGYRISHVISDLHEVPAVAGV